MSVVIELLYPFRSIKGGILQIMNSEFRLRPVQSHVLPDGLKTSVIVNVPAVKVLAVLKKRSQVCL
jgi:hypothetical protein